MYFKLAFRNAKRSIYDYLLYVFSLVMLLSIMLIGFYISIIGKTGTGFQTISLPFLIILILLVLIQYVSNFMLKQRSKEIASYMLLGMEKRYIEKMFSLEFIAIGIGCLIISYAICFFVCLFITAVSNTSFSYLTYLKSSLYTFIYFFIIEFLSIYFIIRRIRKLQICELIIERRHNQRFCQSKIYKQWFLIFLANFFCFSFMLIGIVFLPKNRGAILISAISIPLLLSIFSFYSFLFYFMMYKRKQYDERLYSKDRLYLIAKFTSEYKTNAVLNSIFCVCLLFSIMSFVFGVLMLNLKPILWGIKLQKWMGVLQINICFIFSILFFSILSFKELIINQYQRKDMELLEYLGKNQLELKKVLKKQIFMDLLMPVFMCFLIVLISIPFINYKLNILLPLEMNNICIYSVIIFAVCFIILYLCYFAIIYIISKRNAVCHHYK